MRGTKGRKRGKAFQRGGEKKMGEKIILPQDTGLLAQARKGVKMLGLGLVGRG